MSIVDDYKSINAASSRKQMDEDKYTYYTIRFAKDTRKLNYVTNDKGEIGVLEEGWSPSHLAGGPWYYSDANGKKTP